MDVVPTVLAGATDARFLRRVSLLMKSNKKSEIENVFDFS